MLHPIAALIPYLAILAMAGADKVSLVSVSGDGTQPPLQSPFAIDFNADGELVIAEMTANRIRRIDAKGALSTIAGTGKKGPLGDGGPATLAELDGPHHLAVGPRGDIYVADTWNNRVRKIDAKTGLITTVAGTGRKGFDGDGGPADKATFGGIYCLAFDPKRERLYLADLDNRRIPAINRAA